MLSKCNRFIVTWRDAIFQPNLTAICVVLTTLLLPNRALSNEDIIFFEDFNNGPADWIVTDLSDGGGCNWVYEEDPTGFLVSPSSDPGSEYFETWLESTYYDFTEYTNYLGSGDMRAFGVLLRNDEDLLEIWSKEIDDKWSKIDVEVYNHGYFDPDEYREQWSVQVGVNLVGPIKYAFYYMNTEASFGYWEVDRIEFWATTSSDAGYDDDDADSDESPNTGDDDSEAGCGC